MGYAAGTTANPTYHAIGDHAECLQVDYDPSVIEFSKLLDHFFEWHNAFRKPYSRQYMSAFLWHSEEQKAEWDRQVEAREDDKRKVRTEVQAHSEFTWAEDYHQKYYLRRNRLVARELKENHASLEEFVNSTAVMRANAILGGFLEPQRDELEKLGFGEQAVTELMNRKRSFFGSLLDTAKKLV